MVTSWIRLVPMSFFSSVRSLVNQERSPSPWSVFWEKLAANGRLRLRPREIRFDDQIRCIISNNYFYAKT